MVEESSNANGKYIKWASGILEQWFVGVKTMAINGDYGGKAYVGTTTWTYPLQFSTVDYVICGKLRHGTSASWGTITAFDTSTASITAMDLFSRASGNTSCVFYARGRWK